MAQGTKQRELTTLWMEDLYVTTREECKVQDDAVLVVVDNTSECDNVLPCDVKVCRVCFVTDCRLYSMAVHKSLEEAYEVVTGLSIENEDNLPPYLCSECAQRLLNCVHLRTRSLRAHLILLEVFKKYDHITLEAIKSTIGDQNLFRSNLAVTYNQTDQYDLEFVHTEEEDMPESRNMHNNEVTIVDVKVERDEEDTDSALSDNVDKDSDHNGLVLLSNLQEYADEVKMEDRATNDQVAVTIVNIKVEKDKNEMDLIILGDSGAEGEPCSSAVQKEAKTQRDGQLPSNLKDINDSGNNILDKNVTKQSGEKSYSCNVCMRRCSNKYTLQKHMLVHSDQKSYSCEVCQKVFYKKGNLTTHLRVHSGEKPYSCDRCNKSFSQKSTLKTHLQLHSGEKPYTCNICQRTFGRKGNLRKHLRVHSGDKPFSCELCQKRFGYHSELCQHARKHSGEKPYSCKICPKSYSRSSDLGIHVKTHSGEKPFVCEICNKALGNKTSLKNHLRTHSSEKPYVCDVCQKAFKEKSNLRQHAKIHSGEKPYSCSVCKKAFIGQTSLRKHMIIHSGEKPYVCKICKKAFNKSSNLDKHVRIHTGEKPYSCNVCMKAYSEKNNLRKHMRYHYGYR